jgi:hypothetical protein
MVREIRTPDQGREPLPVAVDQHAEHDVTVSRPVHVCGGGHDEAVPHAGELDTERSQGEEPVRLEEQDVEERHVDVLTFSGRVAVAKRREGREGGVKAGHVVGDEGRGFRGLALGIAVQGEPARRRLRERIVPRALVARSVPSPPADRHVDDVGPDPPNVVVVETQALHRPRSQVLDDDVRARREAKEDVAPVLLSEI